MSQRIKFLKLHPADAADLVYFWATENMDEKKLRKFNLDLWMPPKGVEPDADHPFFGEEAENAEFDKMQGSSGKPKLPGVSLMN